MEQQPFVRGQGLLVLRRHTTVAPSPRVLRLEPGRLLIMPLQADPEREALARAWQAAGGKVQRLARIWAPEPASAEQSVAVYGNAIFCQVLADALNLQLLGPEDDLLARLPRPLTGRAVTVSRLAQAAHLNYPCFVSSLPPKLFTSGIVGSAPRLASLTEGLSRKTGLLVSEVVHFEAEARAFIYDRKVLDLSVYRGKGERDEAMALAETVAALEGTPFGYTVDLGLVSGAWTVMKFHPSWEARLRGCDPAKVIFSIAAATRA